MSDKPDASPKWFTQMSSWLSLFATIVSLTTFYLVNLRNGSIEVQLPEEIGVKLNPDSSIDLLVPTVFYNTGAPNNQRIITAVTATVTLDDNQTLNFSWKDTWDFIGKIEFESRFPDNTAKTIIPPDDYVIYNSRSVPFVVHGRDSDYKMLRIVPLEVTAVSSDLSAFQLILVAKTKDERFETEGSYSVEKDLVVGTYIWFHKLDNNLNHQ